MTGGLIWQRNVAIFFTSLSILGLIGFLTVMGLDLFQEYESSGMYAGYISVTILMGLSGILSVIFWVLYCRCTNSDHYTYTTI